MLLGTITQINQKRELIFKASDEEYWTRANFFDIENIRIELRELIKFIDTPPTYFWYPDIPDTLLLRDNDEEYKLDTLNDYSDYKKKVKKFLTGNMDNMIIYKIKHNQKLNDMEKKDLERIMFEDLG